MKKSQMNLKINKHTFKLIIQSKNNPQYHED